MGPQRSIADIGGSPRVHQECEVGRAPLLGRSSESISTMLKSPTERERELYNFVLLLLCPQRCTQWRTLSETESRPGFRVEWKVTGSAALGVRLLFGLRQGTGGGETKAGHPLRGTRRNLVCMLLFTTRLPAALFLQSRRASKQLSEEHTPPTGRHSFL